MSGRGCADLIFFNKAKVMEMGRILKLILCAMLSMGLALPVKADELRDLKFMLRDAVVYNLIGRPASSEAWVNTYPTYNRVPLQKLLKKHGLFVSDLDFLLVTPANLKTMRNVKEKDVAVTLFISGKSKGLPCKLDQRVNDSIVGGGAQLSDVLYRAGQFQIKDDLEPLLYWAATGKCSTEYGL